MEHKNYRRLQTVVLEGDPVTTFFIVRSGEFEVTKKQAITLENKTQDSKIKQEEVNEGTKSNVEAVLSAKD